MCFVILVSVNLLDLDCHLTLFKSINNNQSQPDSSDASKWNHLETPMGRNLLYQNQGELYALG